MEDREQETGSLPGQASDAEPSPARSRWTPKPEQILILESIFNSGMVNPPKDETVRIRKLLEKFGTVGDANVFYWFQNRRSRSRRRQRQIQASLSTTTGGGGEPPLLAPPRGGAMQYQSSGFPGNQGSSSGYNPGSSCYLMGSGSGFGVNGDNGAASEDIFGFSGHTAPGIQGMEQNSIFLPSDSSSLQNYHAGVITVFINGVSTEVSRGPLNMKAMFGDFVLFHSSGVPVEMNEYGFLVHSLQHGESYFLVPRHS